MTFQRLKDQEESLLNTLFIDSSGNIYATGHGQNSLVGKQFFTVKYDSSHNIEWVVWEKNEPVIDIKDQQTAGAAAGIVDLHARFRLENL